MRILLLAAFLVCSSWSAFGADRGSQSRSNETGNSLGEFSIVAQRNIFDPNRRASDPGRSSRATRDASRPPTTLTLMGAVVRPAGAVALFQGSMARSPMEVEEGGDVGGLRVASINTERVLAAAGATSMTVQVGETLSKPYDGEWQNLGRLASSRPRAPSSSRTQTTSTRESERESDRSTSTRDRTSSRRDRDSQTDNPSTGRNDQFNATQGRFGPGSGYGAPDNYGQDGSTGGQEGYAEPGSDNSGPQDGNVDESTSQGDDEQSLLERLTERRRRELEQ